MSLTKLTDNLNNIQGLADKPTQTASQLKEVFDSAGNTIKGYINNTLTSEVDTALGTKANSSDVYSKTETYTKTEINTALETKADSSDTYTKDQVDELLQGHLLWSGTMYMAQNQTINLSENVSDQKNGIILIWSVFEDNQAKDYWFTHTIISKKQLSYSGDGVSCFISNNGFSRIACKYVYVKNDKINGAEGNTSSGTASGITYNNSAYVLRAVIGF